MNRVLIWIILLSTTLGCARQFYFLPDFEEVHTSPYGAFIKLKMDDEAKITGELLAVEKGKLIIGSLGAPIIQEVDTSKVQEYFIQFSKHKRYGYPVFIAFTHGWWLVFTVPINAILTQITNSQERKELRFYNYDLETLNNYSRFPQGIPEGFSPENYSPAVKPAN